MIDQDKMRALAAELRKGSGGRYKWYAMGRDETSYFMDFDWGYDADRWFADQQRSRAAWIEQEGIHIVKKMFQTELETNAAVAADAIDLLLAEVEAANMQLTVPDWAEGDDQAWDKVTPAVAWHLIERHGENWAHIGRMMQAYLDAHTATLRVELEATASDKK